MHVLFPRAIAPLVLRDTVPHSNRSSETSLADIVVQADGLSPRPFQRDFTLQDTAISQMHYGDKWLDEQTKWQTAAEAPFRRTKKPSVKAGKFPVKRIFLESDESRREELSNWREFSFKLEV